MNTSSLDYICLYTTVIKYNFYQFVMEKKSKKGKNAQYPWKSYYSSGNATPSIEIWMLHLPYLPSQKLYISTFCLHFCIALLGILPQAKISFAEVQR